MSLDPAVALRAVQALGVFDPDHPVSTSVRSDAVVVGDDSRAFRVTPFLPDLLRVRLDALAVVRSRLVATDPRGETYELTPQVGVVRYLSTHPDLSRGEVADVLVEALVADPASTERVVTPADAGDLLRAEDVQRHGVHQVTEEPLPGGGRSLRFWSARWQRSGHGGRDLTLRRWTVHLTAAGAATWAAHDMATGLPIPRYAPPGLSGSSDASPDGEHLRRP